MPTTFSTAYKNRVLDCLTGRASMGSVLTYIQLYNGVQPADPLTTPAGSAVFSSYASSISLSGKMGAPGGGVSAMGSPSQANAASTVSNITFARIYDASGVACIDTPVSLAGGGGGVILDSLNASAGNPIACLQFSFKYPLANGSVKMSSALANYMASLACVNGAASAGVATSGTLVLYSGSAPASADDAPTGTVLATFTTSNPSNWSAASGGAAIMGSSLTVAAGATGSVGYARLIKSSNLILQCSCATSGGDLTSDSNSTTNGVNITINAGTLTF